MAVMADGGFPFGAVGLVHVENRIVQHRPIGIGEELTIRVRPTQAAAPPQGPHLHARHRGPGRRRDRLGEHQHDAAPRQGRRRDAERASKAFRRRSTSRRSGQRRVEARRRPRPPLRRRLRRPQPDPHALADREAARLPGAIAHGMWTKARCLAALESRLPDAFDVDVRFRKPILLPGAGRVRQQRRRARGSSSPCATPSAARRTSTAASSRSSPTKAKAERKSER